MEYCSKCFKQICRCGYYKIELDYYIYPAIYEFNRKGYKTVSSCSGHEKANTLGTYIEFDENLPQTFSSEYIRFDTYKYNGIHVRKNKLKVNPEKIKSFKKKRTDKLRLIQDINSDLYRIAKELPEKTINPEIVEQSFPESYFFDKSYSLRMPDIQEPWMIIIPNTHNCEEFVEQFFDVINAGKIIHEIIIDKKRSDNPWRISSLDFSSTDSHRIKDHIIFDSSSAPNIIQFGLEGNLHIETESFAGNDWFLSYAVISNSEESYYTESSPPLDVMERVSDFRYDNGCPDLINAFEHGFDVLIQNGINICAFSSGKTIAVFSNCLDFSFDGTPDGTAIVFGNIDYEESSLKRVVVDNKEMVIIVNGSILLRKELTHNAS